MLTVSWRRVRKYCENETSWLISADPKVGRWSIVQQKEIPLYVCFLMRH